MISLPQPIPYQGSKRALAYQILTYFPKKIETLYEPFAGSCAITIAAAYYNKASKFIINDLNVPLMELWKKIINQPNDISDQYEKIWKAQLGHEKEHYNFIRQEFNDRHQPDHFLYLLARGVKGAIRYNARGQFNQSPDNRRLGKNPATMRKDINFISRLLYGKTQILSVDFKDAIKNASENDLVYLDPPYQGVCTNRDSRYFSGIEFDDLILSLRKLNYKNIPFILSYDGRTGNKVHGKELPEELKASRIELLAGRSSTATLQGKMDLTIESLYLSEKIAIKFDQLNNRANEKFKPQQLDFPRLL